MELTKAQALLHECTAKVFPAVQNIASGMLEELSKDMKVFLTVSVLAVDPNDPGLPILSTLQSYEEQYLRHVLQLSLEILNEPDSEIKTYLHEGKERRVWNDQEVICEE